MDRVKDDLTISLYSYTARPLPADNCLDTTDVRCQCLDVTHFLIVTMTDIIPPSYVHDFINAIYSIYFTECVE